MKNLSELYIVKDVDDSIDQMCLHCPGLRARAMSGEVTATERASEPKLDAVLKAFERRAELQEEVRMGIRDPDGNLNVPV